MPLHFTFTHVGAHTHTHMPTHTRAHKFAHTSFSQAFLFFSVFFSLRKEEKCFLDVVIRALFYILTHFYTTISTR